MTGHDEQEQIRQRAYEIWMSEGCPDGRDREHWLEAERECRKSDDAPQNASSAKSPVYPVGRANRKRRRK
ncbi:MAG: DUF2934 domain-containing protein [Rhodospirillaceae bacterium]|nr:DUF2934 domain-containing protein [Rhodospirillaceae bacterium]